MNKTEQAQQLRLAATLIETEHPWERYSNGRIWIKSELPVAMAVSHGDPIRPILATPPDNRPLHNPDSFTAEQVGLGYRLCLLADTCDQPFDFWLQSSKSWEKGVARSGTFEHDASPLFTYRLPLSVPWPEPKPSPPPEPATRTVELGPEDVPPFSVIRRKNEKRTWHWRLLSYVHGTHAICAGRGYTWSELACDYEINRSIPLTGRWNPDAWEPCSKTVQIAH